MWSEAEEYNNLNMIVEAGIYRYYFLAKICRVNVSMEWTFLDLVEEQFNNNSIFELMRLQEGVNWMFLVY